MTRTTRHLSPPTPALLSPLTPLYPCPPRPRDAHAHTPIHAHHSNGREESASSHGEALSPRHRRSIRGGSLPPVPPLSLEGAFTELSTCYQARLKHPEEGGSGLWEEPDDLARPRESNQAELAREEQRLKEVERSREKVAWYQAGGAVMQG